MAYDNQAPGWYLLNPEKDGTPPAGEHGSVTKVSSKGGGIKEAVLSNLDLIQGALPAEVEMAVTVGTTVYNTINDARAATDEEESPASGESKSPVGSTSSRATSAPGATKGVGARAAQMRTQMAQAGTVDISVVDSKLAGVNQMVAIESKVIDPERVCSLISLNVNLPLVVECSGGSSIVHAKTDSGIGSYRCKT